MPCLQDMKIWLNLQKLPTDCVGEIVGEILELKEDDPTTGEPSYLSREPQWLEELVGLHWLKCWGNKQNKTYVL